MSKKDDSFVEMIISLISISIVFIGFYSVFLFWVLVAFVVLRLTCVTEWCWFWVLSPIWTWVAFTTSIFTVGGLTIIRRRKAK
jgi:hypothetical protein